MKKREQKKKARLGGPTGAVSADHANNLTAENVAIAKTGRGIGEKLS